MRKFYLTPNRAVTKLANKVIDDMVLNIESYDPNMILQEDSNAIYFSKEPVVFKQFMRIGRKEFGKILHRKEGYYLSCNVLNVFGYGKNKLYIFLDEYDNCYSFHASIKISTRREFVSLKIGIFGVIAAICFFACLGFAGSYEFSRITFLECIQKCFISGIVGGISAFIETKVNPFKYIDRSDK